MASLAPVASRELARAVRDLDAVHCRLAREDPNAFMTYVMRDERTGRRVAQSANHERWHRALDQYRRVLVWSHTEAGKSFQLSVGRTLWELGRDPSQRHVIVMNTDGQAQKLVSLIAQYIEGSEELHRVFPELRPAKGMPWTKHQLFLERPTRSKDPSVQSCGAHGNILGARIDRLKLDDILDHENAFSPTQRDRLASWLDTTLWGRLTDRARVAWLGNVWHRSDYAHRLAKGGLYHVVRSPVLDAQGRSTWPEVWPLRRVQDQRELLGPVEFARQMMCLARSDEDARFKRAWVEGCIQRGEGKTLCAALQALPPGYATYTGVDLGVRTTAGSDLTCLFTICVHPNGDREVLYVESGRWAGPEIVDRIIQAHRNFMSIVVVESVAAQQFILDFTRKLSAVPVRPYHTTSKTFRSPEFGIESLATEMANGKWIIPSKGGTMHRELDQWVQELLMYDPRAHAGDRLMASWFAREGALQTRPTARVRAPSLSRR